MMRGVTALFCSSALLGCCEGKEGCTDALEGCCPSGVDCDMIPFNNMYARPPRHLPSPPMC